MTITPKHHYQLNEGQLAVLNTLYTFRFATTKLLAEYLRIKNRTTLQSRLNILLEQGYIGRHFDSSYRLRGKFAAYYLLPKGVKELVKRSEPGALNDRAIRSSYKNSRVSEQFVDHTLHVFAVHGLLKALYGDTMKFFTKNELGKFTYFPQPLPDAFISLKTDTVTKRFLLEFIDVHQPYFLTRKTVQKYVDYFNDGAWDATNADFPEIILVCENTTVQKQLSRLVTKLVGEFEDEELSFKILLPSQLSNVLLSDRNI